MKPRLFDAVHALVGGQVSGGSKYPASYRFHDGQTPPTEKAVTDKLAELEADYDAKEYQRKRQPEYPEIGDQLDALYHAGVFPAEMTATLKAVKDKYPKG